MKLQKIKKDYRIENVQVTALFVSDNIILLNYSHNPLVTKVVVVKGKVYD